jgi:hypothetical protein
MKKELMNLFLFIFICFIVYLLFRNFNFSYKEGMTTSNAPASASAVTPTSNGIAGNASAYGATLKAANIKLQDTFLISKYRSDYENAILNLDDLINSLMLQTALSVNTANPSEAVKKLADMNAAKTALNTVMKFVDKST